MINFILENKEWLFSGIGVFIVTGAWKFFTQSKSGASPVQLSKSEIPTIQEEKMTDKVDEISEVKGIVNRLNKFKELLNENRAYDEFTIAKLAEIMGLKSVGELENYFKGKSEPDFEFLKNFCNVFGVSYSWLSEGKGEPFYINKQTNYDPLAYYPYIEALHPEKIYFIRSDAREGYTFILLKLFDWKYEILHRSWNISSHVGAGGQSQIYGMYKLIKKLKEKSYLKCYGRILKDKDFDLLFQGKKFPSSIIDFKNQDSPWWDDFTDINHSYAISKNYENWYGSEFMAAQRIVKLFLEQENK